MIYFLINNTFHFNYVISVIDDLNEWELGLIQIPYSLKPIYHHPRFKAYFIFERLKYFKEYFVNWPRKLCPYLVSNRLKIKNVDKKLNPQKEDVLFVFTEEELLNLIVINKFKNSGSRIYLIEDGIASYMYYCVDSDPISKRSKLFMYLIRSLYGLKGYYPFTVNGYVCQRLSDSYYSGICYFLPIEIKRNIPVHHVRKNLIRKPEVLNKNAVFLTQPLYSFFISFEEYLINLSSIIDEIYKNFDKLYIKFHPDEIISGLYLEIKTHLSKHSNVVFLTSNSIIENIISEYDIKFVISYHSSALMNLLFFGIEPIYIYHFFDFLLDRSTVQLTQYLKSLNYNFVGSLGDIGPHFKSNLMEKTRNGISLNEVIKKTS